MEKQLENEHAREQAMQEVVIATDQRSMALFQQLSHAHTCMNNAVAAKDKLAAEVEKRRQSLTVRGLLRCACMHAYACACPSKFEPPETCMAPGCRHVTLCMLEAR